MMMFRNNNSTAILIAAAVLSVSSDVAVDAQTLSPSTPACIPMTATPTSACTNTDFTFLAYCTGPDDAVYEACCPTETEEKGWEVQGGVTTCVFWKNFVGNVPVVVDGNADNVVANTPAPEVVATPAVASDADSDTTTT